MVRLLQEENLGDGRVERSPVTNFVSSFKYINSPQNFPMKFCNVLFAKAIAQQDVLTPEDMNIPEVGMIFSRFEKEYNMIINRDLIKKTAKLLREYCNKAKQVLFGAYLTRQRDSAPLLYLRASAVMASLT